jgi:hypothetical protein
VLDKLAQDIVKMFSHLKPEADVGQQFCDDVEVQHCIFKACGIVGLCAI